jgi:hypothetical protein
MTWIANPARDKKFFLLQKPQTDCEALYNFLFSGYRVLTQK